MRALPLALLTLIAPSPARAWVPSTTTKTVTPIKWMASNCAQIVVNSNGSKDAPGEASLAAVKRAMQNWMTATGSCSYLKMVDVGDKPDAKAEFNRNGSNENVIVWVESGWKDLAGAHDPLAAALTTVYFIDKQGKADGQIMDADMELNGTNFHFSADGAANLTDIENTVTHELGHLLGLDHPCEDQANPPYWPKDNTGAKVPYCYPQAKLPAWIRDLTMYNFADPGETKKRTPKADDIAGVCETYPVANDPGQCTAAIYLGDDGGCAVGGRARGAGLVLLLLGPAIWLVWRLR
jgi:hypothetical protein